MQLVGDGIADDGSNDETDKYLPVLVRYEGPDGLIQTSLLDMPDINVGPDARTMFNTIDMIMIDYVWLTLLAILTQWLGRRTVY